MTDHAWSVLRDVVTLLILGITVWAIVYGPVRAVVVQRDSDEKREAKRRKFLILHSLMKTRAWVLHQDHVTALNLIQLEFYEEQAVLAAFRNYVDHLSTPFPTATPEVQPRFNEERKERFYSLLKAIADVLGFRFDKADLERLSYVPQGWHDDLTKQNQLRSLLIEAFEGRRPLPVSQFHLSAVNSKFPSPPVKDGDQPTA